MKYKICKFFRKTNGFFYINWLAFAILLITFVFSASLTYFNQADIYTVLKNSTQFKNNIVFTDTQLENASNLIFNSKYMLSSLIAFSYFMKPLIEALILLGILLLMGKNDYQFKMLYKQCFVIKNIYSLQYLVIFIAVKFFTPMDRPLSAYLPLTFGDFLYVRDISSWIYDINLFVAIDFLLFILIFHYYRKISLVPLLLSQLLACVVLFFTKWMRF